ncbi:helix-turn-helix domain-containing protein [Alcanivorax jadensis]|uniref:helix-turn-helix domain-containing protein n=1 Tax=Alcanivorax jadensis TaxID=64988 RepID=UPI0039C86B58
MSEPKGQSERLLERLKLGPVNPLQAWQELGIYRLSARVMDLREAGHNIITVPANVTNRFGENCRVAEYHLENRP